MASSGSAGDMEHVSVVGLKERYEGIRRRTRDLAAPLSAEDCQAQSMPDASPVKWHLAHTTWFFETFVLERTAGPFAHLFNSYYESLGPRVARSRRGSITRPSLEEVLDYRSRIDAEILARFEALDAALIETGLHHEQQHQELILTDVKHLLSLQWPGSGREAALLHPPPREGGGKDPGPAWSPDAGGLVEVGHAGPGFAFDNEGPRHRVFLEPFRLSPRLASCGDYLAFMEEGGYRRPELWLSEGWDAVRTKGWEAPLYWRREDGGWSLFTLSGRRPIDPDEPVCHVSYYEADAFARWAGARLPSEHEWEAVAAAAPREGRFAEDGHFHPRPGGRGWLGDVWVWTRSAYGPYPGYRAPDGALGEYNGKFMCGQMVLRGGSCATPASHIRPTYRNFFPPSARWQFSGVRLAKDG